MSDDTVTYKQGRAIACIARIKDRNGWASTVSLKTLGVDGRTLNSLLKRGLIEKHFVGPIMDLNSVRLTRVGRRYV